MEKQVDVAIIGAGTAGLSAFKEAAKVTDNLIIIDHGPLGTTCARVGCMPSKALIQVAHDFHRRHAFSQLGIQGGEKLTLNIPAAMEHVRKLRDRFSGGVAKNTEKLGDKLLCGSAEFLEPTVLKVGEHIIRAKKIIIATGSSTIIPDAWAAFKNELITSDTLFEQADFPAEIGVIGAGVIGLELGQALSHFGIKTHIFHGHEFIGGLSDPEINRVAVDIVRQDVGLHLNARANVTYQNNIFDITANDKTISVPTVLAALGRSPNVDKLNLAKIGVPFDDHGLPVFNKTTLQVAGLPIFIAGDVGKQRPLLHEAADEGRIAGFNATHEITCFKRRIPLVIVFSDPAIAFAGFRYNELDKEKIVTGSVNFSDQGRARMMLANKGKLHLYADKEKGCLLGAEMIAPGAEHFAHLCAWAIQQKLTVFDLLQLPFYHPVLEEGFRTAVRDCAAKVSLTCSKVELATCRSAAVEGLS